MGNNRDNWPTRIIDSHLHIYDDDFPLIENATLQARVFILFGAV